MIFAILRNGITQHQRLLETLRTQFSSGILLDGRELDDIDVIHISKSKCDFCICGHAISAISRIIAFGLPWQRLRLSSEHPTIKENESEFCGAESRASVLAAVLLSDLPIQNISSIHPKHANTNSTAYWRRMLSKIGWKTEVFSWSSPYSSMHPQHSSGNEGECSHLFTITITQRSCVASPGRKILDPRDSTFSDLIARTQLALIQMGCGWLNLDVSWGPKEWCLHNATQSFRIDIPDLHVTTVAKDLLSL
jgi:hypothetical protein